MGGVLRAGWSFLVRLWAGVEEALGGVATGGMRSVLTVLGVTIGVASVVSLLAVGEGARLAVAAQYQSLGTNVITVESHSGQVVLTTATAQQLTARVAFITAAMPVVGVSAPVYWRQGDAQGSAVTVLGVTPDLLKIRDEAVVEGSFLSPLEQDAALHVAVLGATAAEGIFGGLDPIDQDILIGQAPFRVIGVLAAQGGATVGSGTVPVLGAGASSTSSTATGATSGTSASGSATTSTAQQTVAVGSGIDDAVLIPESTAEWLAGTTQVSAIWMKATSRDDVAPAVLQTERILALLFNLSADLSSGQTATGQGPGGPGGYYFKGGPLTFGPGGFIGAGNATSTQGGSLVIPGEGGAQALTVQSLDDLVQQADAANRVLTLMLTAIAGVSLLVGGIGVMNIMLVSVQERTVEIGLRKAMGALQLDLLYQFVIEAVVLSGLGGLCGWLGGFGGVRLLQHYGVQAASLPGALGVALGAAAGVGVLFGTYPAYLASELQPVEALRRQ